MSVKVAQFPWIPSFLPELGKALGELHVGVMPNSGSRRLWVRKSMALLHLVSQLH